MNAYLTKIKLKLIKFSHLFPTKLPIGMTDFGVWADSIIINHGLPDNDSLRFALATMVLHLEATSKVEVNLGIIKVSIPMSAYKSKRYFAQGLLKSASNQIAAGVMHELKEKQQEKMKAEEEAKKNAIVPQG